MATKIKPPQLCKDCKQYPRAEGSSRCEPCSAAFKRKKLGNEQLMRKIKNQQNNK